MVELLPTVPTLDAGNLVFDTKRRRVRIEDRIDIGPSAAYHLLHALAVEHLRAAGKGLDPFDYPLVTAQKRAQHLGLASEEHVRKSVTRSRSLLSTRFGSAGLDPQLGETLIENIPWKG